MVADGIAEGAEEAGGNGVAFRPIFRVPLDADCKGGCASDRHRLDRAVSRHGFDRKARRDPPGSLPMKRVYPYLPGSKDAG